VRKKASRQSLGSFSAFYDDQVGRGGLCLLILVIVLVCAAPAAAQTPPPLPPALYVLNNTGQVSRLETETLTVTPVTPPPETAESFVIDLGIDAQGERLAYRTANGLFVRALSSGAVRQIEGNSAGLPAFRGRGATITFSPGGDVIIYATLNGARVFFDPTLTTTPENLPVFSTLTEGAFYDFAWSPGGTFVAGAVEGGIWWVYRRDGTALTLASVITSANGIAWVSDTALAFAPVEGGLRLMRLDQANAQSPILDDTVVYALPTLTADDALAFFGRAKNDAVVPEGFGRLLRLGRGASAVETLSAIPVSLANLRWVPGGGLLLAFQGGALALLDPVSGEILTLPYADAVAYVWSPLNAPVAAAAAQPPAVPIPLTTALPGDDPNAPTPALTAVGVVPTPTFIPDIPSSTPETADAVSSMTGEPPDIPTVIPNPTDSIPSGAPSSGAPLPVSVNTLTPTPDPLAALTPTDALITALPTTPPAPATGIPTSADGFFLARDANGIAQVWWLPRTGLPAARFTNSGADVTAFAVAAGGRRVAYQSDGGLWLQRFEVPQPTYLVDIESFAPITPDFSPDGTLIAYADESALDGGIWLVSIDGQSERLVPNSGGRTYRRPQFAPEGDRLLVDAYVGDTAIVNAIVDLTVRTIIEAPPSPADDTSALTARWLTGGRYVVVRDANTGGIDPSISVYNASAPGTLPASSFLLDAETDVRAAAEIAAGQLRIAFDDPAGGMARGAATLQIADFLLGQRADVTQIDAVIAPRFTPDGVYLAGYAALTEIDGVRQGALIIQNIETGARTILTQPEAVWAFQWAG
jgi:hypothetical protein